MNEQIYSLLNEIDNHSDSYELPPVSDLEMKKWKKYLESLNDISEIDNVIEKAAALKHQDLYKIACEIKQSKL